MGKLKQAKMRGALACALFCVTISLTLAAEVQMTPQFYGETGTQAPMSPPGLAASLQPMAGTPALLEVGKGNYQAGVPQTLTPNGVPSYVSGLPHPFPMASPFTLGHLYGGYGMPVHPMYQAMHAMIGAPPPPLIPYGAPYYPPYA
eukprot:c13215_g1_i1.p2 GENE.c13215_g1_i1~~c13215_g1_i1.p2  ORF type:complete len:146 (-),score=22.59 c13215_g1_i1:96-533(-)